MKALLPALAALSLLAASSPALTAPSDTATPPSATPRPASSSDVATAVLTAPTKITRWEDSGMKPAEAREWQQYGFTAQEGMNWRNAGFEPVVARTWSDKGFDAEEAQLWRDSVRNSRTLMSEMDRADAASWKREGFSPADRLAWWEAGFVFDDAVLLARAGMTPADAAWHGHEKLKELRGTADAPATRPTIGSPAVTDTRVVDVDTFWQVAGPFLKIGLVGVLAFLAGGFVFFLYRRDQINGKLSRMKAQAPDSEAPPDGPVRLGPKVLEKRKPAQAVRLFRRARPQCVHCRSTNVRLSKMKPHKFAGINFTEYFRCRSCGRHFAIVSYTQIVLAGGAIALSVLIVTATFIYLSSMG